MLKTALKRGALSFLIGMGVSQLVNILISLGLGHGAYLSVLPDFAARFPNEITAVIAQALLTGEVRHHNALAAAGSGFVLYQGGHFGTEGPLVPLLAKALQNAMNALQYDIVVYPSDRRPYGGRPAL